MGAELAGLEELRAGCAEVGMALEQISPALQRRLQLLAATTQTLHDAEHILQLARAIFRYYDTHKPEQRWSASEKRVVVVGSLFADIGKTGPLRASTADQQLIAQMFGVEGVRDEQQSVAHFLRASFPKDAAARIARFGALGLDPNMSMRSFWNLHASWTLELVRDAGVPEEAVAGAATHHLLDDVNPEAIVGHDGRYSTEFGDNTTFDRAEKLVILLDKYDAMRRRSGGTHAQAIAWLRRRLGEHPAFRADREFHTLLEDLDVVAQGMA